MEFAWPKVIIKYFKQNKRETKRNEKKIKRSALAHYTTVFKETTGI